MLNAGFTKLKLSPITNRACYILSDSWEAFVIVIFFLVCSVPRRPPEAIIKPQVL